MGQAWQEDQVFTELLTWNSPTGDQVVLLPNYQERHDLNMQPTDLKSDTLPIELLSLQLWFA